MENDVLRALFGSGRGMSQHGFTSPRAPTAAGGLFSAFPANLADTPFGQQYIQNWSDREQMWGLQALMDVIARTQGTGVPPTATGATTTGQATTAPPTSPAAAMTAAAGASPSTFQALAQEMGAEPAPTGKRRTGAAPPPYQYYPQTDEETRARAGK